MILIMPPESARAASGLTVRVRLTPFGTTIPFVSQCSDPAKIVGSGMMESTVQSHVRTDVDTSVSVVSAVAKDILERNALVSLSDLPLAVVPSKIRTPLKLHAFMQLLRDYEDKVIVAEIHDILSYGASIGFTGSHHSRFTPNAVSAIKHADVLRKSILKEVANGFTVGPFLNPPFSNFVVSSLGVRPKKKLNVVTGYRIIMDLSRPFGDSVNCGIDKNRYSVRYAKFDDAIALCIKAGKGALLGKMDIKSAFRLVPVRPEDWHLLGFSFDDRYFFDVVLPFGSRSSPYLFCLFSNVLHWSFSQSKKDDPLVHYMDDYLFVGPPDSPLCQVYMDDFCVLCGFTGVPLAGDKTEGPAPVIVFLGIVIDTINQTISLPAGKKDEIMAILDVWRMKKTATKFELQSLIGHLMFAAKCIPAGRAFTRRLINCLSVFNSSNQFVVSNDIYEDILWWREFLPKWNGSCSFMSPSWLYPNQTHLYTDASSKIGMAAYLNGKYFHVKWSDFSNLNSPSIELLEMLPIFAAVSVWAESFRNKRIIFHCDNLPCVQAWARLASRNAAVMSLIRQMIMIAATHNFAINILHVAGTSNEIADALSRFQKARFLNLTVGIETKPLQLPTHVRETVQHHLSLSLARSES